MTGEFKLYKDKGGENRFHLKPSNGQNIPASEGYKQNSSATNGIESVKKKVAKDSSHERKDTKTGKFMFNLKAINGQVIGASESYETEIARDNGIESVKKNAPGVSVDYLTE